MAKWLVIQMVWCVWADQVNKVCIMNGVCIVPLFPHVRQTKV